MSKKSEGSKISEGKEAQEEMFSFAQAAARLGMTKEGLYMLARNAGVEPAQPGTRGRGRGAKLSKSQVEQLRQVRIARLEEELRKVKGEG